MGLSSGKKICLSVLILGLVAIIIGGVSPYWLLIDLGTEKHNVGLWYQCSDTKPCHHYNWQDSLFLDFTAWFYALHATAGLAIVISFFGLLSALGKLLGDKDTGIPLAVTLLVAGCLGIAATVLFYIKRESEAVSPGFTGKDLPVDWSYYVFAAGTGVTSLFSCFLMCIPKDKSRVHPY